MSTKITNIQLYSDKSISNPDKSKYLLNSQLLCFCGFFLLFFFFFFFFGGGGGIFYSLYFLYIHVSLYQLTSSPI